MHKRPISNPFFADVQRHGITINVPSRDKVRRPSIVKSLRVPVTLWRRVEKQAAREKITTNAAVRQALMIWLRS